MRVAQANLLLMVLWGTAHAASPWYYSTLAQGFYTEYAGTTSRASLTGWGVFASAEYLEDAAFTLGYNNNTLTSDNGDDVTERHVYTSARANFDSDRLRGRLSLRVDLHNLADRTDAGTNHVRVTGLVAGFRDRRARRYGELGYATSMYDAAQANGRRVVQWAPSFGGLVGERDWVQLRGYLIQHGQNHGMRDSAAMRAAELKWTHPLSIRGSTGLEKFTLMLMAGELMYAVDPDTADVYSLSDKQRSALALTATYRLASTAHLMLGAGVRNFVDAVTDEKYSGSHIYLSGSKTW